MRSLQEISAEPFCFAAINDLNQNIVQVAYRLPVLFMPEYSKTINASTNIMFLGLDKWGRMWYNKDE
jgi:hypothetical protein